MLRRRWRVLLSVFLVVVAAVAAYTFTRQKEYSSTAEIYFRDPGLDQKLFGTSSFVPAQTTAADSSATNVGLLSVPAVRALAAARLGIAHQVVDRDIAVSPVGQSSSLVDIVATDPVAGRAALIANAVASSFLAYRQRADRSQLTSAEGLVQSQLSALTAAHKQNTSNFSSLQSRANQLQILAALQTGRAEIVQLGTVSSVPSKPNHGEYLVLGLLLGLVLGIGAALVRERTDRRVRDSSELEALLQMPVLVDIPDGRGLVDAWRTPSSRREMQGIQEGFRMLVARLRYFNVDRRTQVVLVVSSLPQEGKSTVSWHLAKAAALAGDATLLVEADLHRPSIASRHGLRHAPGLAETLPLDGTDLSAAVQRVPILEPDGDDEGPDAVTFDVLVAGALAPNPAALLGSHRMEDLLRDARARYDFVVIDSPPTSAVSDVYPLVRHIDGVVVVARAARSERPSLLDLRRQLGRLNAPVLGVVANAVSSRQRGYSYGGYGYTAVGHPPGSSNGVALDATREPDRDSPVSR